MSSTKECHSFGDDGIVSWSWDAVDEYDKPDPLEITPTSTGGTKRGPPFRFTYNSGVYVLRLEDEKYYIGMSRNLEQRIHNHFDNDGSLWTKKYHPIEVVETRHILRTEGRTFYTIENYVTKLYMEQYGIENVRGGDWAHPDLDECPPPAELREKEDNSDTLDEIAQEMV